MSCGITGLVVAMGKLHFGRLSAAWPGEAADFTPLLAERLDQLGASIGLDLASIGKSEVATAGGRRIDIVAQGADGSDIVIENQYGRADHDHLTRGLAYAVAARARGLVIVAEEHRDEFRAVAEYLNDLAESDSDRGIAVWLVEVRAVKVDDSAWAPLFTAVVQPNDFVASIEQAKGAEPSNISSLDDFWTMFHSQEIRVAAQEVVQFWQHLGYRLRLGPNHVVLEAPGPAVSGIRTVIAVYADGRVLVPFSSYAGGNSGIPIAALTTEEFRGAADTMFGFSGSERQARTAIGWLTPDRVHLLQQFCTQVANAYKEASMNAEA